MGQEDGNRGERRAAGTPVEVTALYATDGCVITSSIALLTNSLLGAEPVYIFSYDAYTHDGRADGPTEQDRFEESRALYQASGGLNGDSFRVTFCLLGTEVGGTHQARGRTRPMFVCRFERADDVAALQEALAHGTPLQPDHIAATLDAEATFALHANMILALTVAINNASPRTGRDAAAAQYDQGASLRSLVGRTSLGQRGLTTLYVHHEARVLAAYRRAYYGSAQSPFWFLSKFGPDEKSLVLTTRYYLLQAQRLGGAGATYDLQAIKDICATYAIPHAPRPDTVSAASLTSFAAITRFCCTSQYARGAAAAGFPLYVERRIAADVRETSALEKFITHDRSCLRVSDREFITYIYLAHFECFSPPRLATHLRAVTTHDPNPAASTEQPSPLGREAVEQFFCHVRAQLNIGEYVKHNVTPRETVLDGDTAKAYLRARTYAPGALTPAPAYCGAVDSATKMMGRLADAEKLLVPRGWPAFAPASPGEDTAGGTPPPQTCGIVKRLLRLAATEQQDTTPPAIAALIRNAAVQTPLPVYRISMVPTGQAFAALAWDDWARITRDARLAEAVVSAEAAAHPDHGALGRRLTDRIRTQGPVMPPGGLDAGGQMYVNRNEIFNGALAITNIILDLDIALKEPVPFRRLHEALGHFRRGALAAVQLLFPAARVDPDAYPCYFFKSACRPGPASVGSGSGLGNDDDGDWFPCYDDAGDEEWAEDPGAMDTSHDPPDDEVAYFDLCHEVGPTAEPRKTDSPVCSCTDKIGLRVCMPVPAPYVVHGSLTMRGVARVIQQAVLLDRDFVEAIGSYVKNFLLIDTGVYAHGHSLRLPYFAKIAPDGPACGRLLPVFVIPPACKDVPAFVAAHADPRRFHFHAPPTYLASPREIRVLHSLGGDYVSFFERKASRNALEHFGRRETLTEVLGRYNVQPDAGGTVEGFASELLGRIVACIETHFPEHAGEYQAVSVRRAVSKDDWVLLQLVPVRGTLQQSLSCLRFKHGRASRATARTFVALSVGANNRLCVSLCQQCFAAKCDSNRLHTLFTIDAGTPCSPSVPCSTSQPSS
ncbi:UL52 [Human alphaherpesvirus 1]|nr:UL52 [Human alphaherpesvirus 1]UPH93340.1 UL52 [Human alphaherpesvirus 1]UPH93493.1 UL52 [Human alphaherpesvirus 1]UPH93644.1 UL52 [Human alphaherpesvirus 1]UPH93717.1 UL52 [Human alphaherpesvirus 1]